jgi:hypothetical protein
MSRNFWLHQRFGDFDGEDWLDNCMHTVEANRQTKLQRRRFIYKAKVHTLKSQMRRDEVCARRNFVLYMVAHHILRNVCARLRRELCLTRLAILRERSCAPVCISFASIVNHRAHLCMKGCVASMCQTQLAVMRSICSWYIRTVSS